MPAHALYSLLGFFPFLCLECPCFVLNSLCKQPQLLVQPQIKCRVVTRVFLPQSHRQFQAHLFLIRASESTRRRPKRRLRRFSFSIAHIIPRVCVVCHVQSLSSRLLSVHKFPCSYIFPSKTSPMRRASAPAPGPGSTLAMPNPARRDASLNSQRIMFCIFLFHGLSALPIASIFSQ